MISIGRDTVRPTATVSHRPSSPGSSMTNSVSLERRLPPRRPPAAGCDRRGFLHVGLLGSLGLSLADVLRIEAAQAGNAGPSRSSKSVIILWMRGGPSQHETWDPKPAAPVEYRGYFGASSTTVPGVAICDLLPRCAAIMDDWSIIRSLHHTDAGHSAGDQLCFTGYPNEGSPDTNTYPSCGSVVAKQLQHLDRDLPAYVMIPRRVPGTEAAYLGPGCSPSRRRPIRPIRASFAYPICSSHPA